ncbi:response regulator [Lachnoclostridium sp.]|uniref:response regulator transcription factor n=1 Tax=Lachnoclostridium sp. TaxID=2028282 RepID=UPI00289BE92B|nr:response regulator [Lachnoclostridium sp.]
MFHILLVDDEPLVRLKMKALTDWERHGYEITGEASDGTEALKILEQKEFDIVLVDISMPGMDGITLIREMKEKNLEPQILMLSAYNDFHFVREAFTLGAIDYVMKNEVSVEKMLNLFQKCKENLKNRAVQKERQHISYRVEQAQLMEELLLKEVTIDLKERMKASKLKLSEKNLVVACILIDHYQLLEERHDEVVLLNMQKRISTMLEQKTQEYQLGEIVSLNPKSFVYLMSFPKEVSQQAIQYKIQSILTNISCCFRQYFNLSVSCGVSSVTDGFHHVKKLYAQALETAQLRMVYGTGRILGENERTQISKDYDEFDRALLHDIVVSLSEDTKEKLKELLLEFEKRVKELCLLSTAKAVSFYSGIMYELVSELGQKGIKISELFEEKIDFYKELSAFETLDEMNQWFRSLVQDIYDRLNQGKTTQNYKLKNAMKYINKHYTEGISLRQVSDYCEVSESYLSRLFTEQIGESFINYLTGLRIKLAKKLMEETNEPIGDIGKHVGYENQEHFSRMFKKITGKSPSSFRNEFMNVHENEKKF